MKPLELFGHERAITKIRFNYEGDLIFTASKGEKVCVWYSHNGEQLGTYNSDRGAVFSFDVDYMTKNLISVHGEYATILWDIETGKQLRTEDEDGLVKCCGFSYSGNVYFSAVQANKDDAAYVKLFDIRQPQPIGEMINEFGSPYSTGTFTHLDRTFAIGLMDGTIGSFDVGERKVVKSVKDHRNAISDMQLNDVGSLMITSSQDNTCNLYSTENLELLKSYDVGCMVKSASISSKYPHLVIGTGQEASQVTTVGSKKKFDTKFYHLIYNEEFAVVRDHFGPVNSVNFHPDGSGYASGSEDGLVKLHKFDEDYMVKDCG
ncbi:hypothetical protein SNEBB_006766 [Seison nebaliae]|nr:hypothetical protein SNEBB_006766 [Seison nebaliae]